MPEIQQNKVNQDTSDSNGSPQSTPDLSWKVHPIVENRIKSVLLLLFLTIILSIIYISFQSIVFLFLSACILIGPLYKYFLPYNYHCDLDTLTVSTCCSTTNRSWDTFKSSYVDKNGILLSPFSKPTRLENFRGIYVRFGKHPPEEIINYIQTRISTELNDDSPKS